MGRLILPARINTSPTTSNSPPTNASMRPRSPMSPVYPPACMRRFTFRPSDMLSRLPRVAGRVPTGRSGMAANPIILVHGGAWAIPDDVVEAHLHGVQAAAAQGWQALQRGGSCLDAIEAAVVAMEE